MERTENRQVWYDGANKWEEEFVEKYGKRFNVIVNPSKALNVTAPDLYLLKTSVSADLKLLGEPFYTSEKIYGIPPRYCWTFNPSDLFEYSVKYSDRFGIFIWKRFKDSENYGVHIKEEEAVYYTTLFELKDILKRKGKIHHYVKRMNDTNGNSYGSYGVDLRSFREF